jgi:hypothetical protein
MPVKWTIDPEDRLILVVAEGDVTRAEVDSMLDAMQPNEVLAYRKLFDGARADTSMAPEDLMALGVRLRSMRGPGSLGALAMVVPPDKEKLLQRVFGMLAVADRPMRVFNDSDQARRWLQKQVAGSKD